MSDALMPTLSVKPRLPDLRLFVAEDLSKPENRANVWLIAAMSIEPFWTSFAVDLKVSSECVREPRQWPNRRPDLTIFENDEPIGIIECENFGANLNQIESYKTLNVKLYQILGTAGPSANLTWSRIKDIALDARPKALPRERVVLDLLVAAIDHISGMKSKGTMRWLDRVPDNAWFKEACLPLLSLSEDIVRLHGAGEGSASLRLLKPRELIRPKGSGLGMAMIQGGHPTKVFFPSSKHLTKHLDSSLAA